jgi:hypothetical protein
MRCGAFHRVEGTLCLVRHGQAALSGSKTKAPGFAGGYLLFSNSPSQEILPIQRWPRPAGIAAFILSVTDSKRKAPSSAASIAPR